jgi:N-acetylglucosamine kinase-like BadF-type ATPase
MKYLAVDVGGSSTRAAIVEEDGTCVGFGKAGSGNPTSFDAATAVTAILGATEAALIRAGSKLADLAGGVVGIAGAAGDTGPPLRVELIRAGLPERLTFESDLLVTYRSGSLATEGYALVAGTGAAAVRLGGGHIEATCDGLGWLLGDGGSGFWIGHRAVLAATSSLDDRAPPTVLGDLVLSRLGVERTSERGRDGRLLALRRAVDAVYRMRPVQLAGFAPLAFEAEALGDDVARRIIAEAGEALAATLGAVVVEDVTGPLVLGGSILSQQPSVSEPVVRSFNAATAADALVITVSDGTVGAAASALRHGGVPVDDIVFLRLQTSLAALR